MNAVSRNFRNAAVGTVFGGSLILTAGMGVAGAEPLPAPVPDGLVNVVQGDVVLLEGVPADVVAGTVAELCGPSAPDAYWLTQQVDTSGVSQTACAGLPAGDVVVVQNVSTSPVVPGTEGQSAVDPAAEPAAPVPPGSEESADGDTSGAGAAEPPPEPEEGSPADTPATDEGIGATWDPI